MADSGIRTATITFTTPIISKGMLGDPPAGDSWLIETRNIETDAGSLVQYELCEDGAVENEGFYNVMADSIQAAALNGSVAITLVQGQSLAAVLGSDNTSIVLTANTGWCIVRVEAVNNISGNMAFIVESSGSSGDVPGNMPVQLVQSRPVPLPALRPGCGYFEDFALTGAIEWAVSDGSVKAPVAGGVRITSGEGTVWRIDQSNSWAGDFEFETLIKRVSGAQTSILFRESANGADYYAVLLSSADELLLKKSTAGVVSTLNTVTGITTASLNNIGIRVIGSYCWIFVNGVLVVSRGDMAYTHRQIAVSASDNTPGQAVAELQYYAVKPL
jgi:hypothetical protein